MRSLINQKQDNSVLKNSFRGYFFILPILLIFFILPATAQKLPDLPGGKVKVKKGDKSRKADKGTGTYQGDASPNTSRMQANRNENYVVVKGDKARKLNKDMSKNSGDMDVYESRMKGPRNENYVVVDGDRARKASKQMANNTGDMQIYESRMQGPRNSETVFVRREIDRKEQKRMANNTGDISMTDLNKRNKQIRQKDKQVAHYSGDITVRSLQQRDKKIRKKGKEMANFKGDIIVKKVKKGMHPSAVYKGGKVKNSYEAKERYRKRVLKKYGKNEGLEDANYMKQKNTRPKHDAREGEIWY